MAKAPARKTTKKPSTASTPATGRTSTPKATAPTKPPKDAPTPAGFRAAFVHWLPTALRETKPKERKHPIRDTRLLLGNCLAAHRAMEKAGITDAEIAKHLPLVDLAKVRAVVPIARALVYASGRVPSEKVSDGEITLRVHRLSPKRENTLRNAESLADQGLLPADRVRAIRAGTGLGDMADDAVQLAGLYEEFAARLVGKHPYKPEHFGALREDGEWLLENLGTKAKGDDLAADDPPPEAADRDALFTLLDAYYTEVLRVAGYFSPRDPGAIAPLLLSQAGAARVAPGDEEEGGTPGGGAAGGGGNEGEGTPKGDGKDKPAPK